MVITTPSAFINEGNEGMVCVALSDSVGNSVFLANNLSIYLAVHNNANAGMVQFTCDTLKSYLHLFN